MELEIKGNQYSFKFGVKFIRELDKRRSIEQNGIKFGMALMAGVIPELKTANVATLSDVLYLANRTESPKLKQDEIDDYIDECEDLESLFDEVITEISESSSGKLAMAKLNQ